MKVRINTNSITVSDIFNESMAEQIDEMVSKSGCIMKKYSDAFGTKANMTGTPEQLENFKKLWNGEEIVAPTNSKSQTVKNNTVMKTTAKKTASKTEVTRVAHNKAVDPQLNKTQQKVFDNEDLSKSEKFRRLFKHGVTKAHIARLFGSPYAFVKSAIDRQEGLTEEVAEKSAKKAVA